MKNTEYQLTRRYNVIRLERIIQDIQEICDIVDGPSATEGTWLYNVYAEKTLRFFALSTQSGVGEEEIR